MMTTATILTKHLLSVYRVLSLDLSKRQIVQIRTSKMTHGIYLKTPGPLHEHVLMFTYIRRRACQLVLSAAFTYTFSPDFNAPLIFSVKCEAKFFVRWDIESFGV